MILDNIETVFLEQAREQVKKTIEELTYRSYRAQRKEFPLIEACRWGAIYPEQVALEVRYQAEEAQAKEVAIEAQCRKDPEEAERYYADTLWSLRNTGGSYHE